MFIFVYEDLLELPQKKDERTKKASEFKDSYAAQTKTYLNTYFFFEEN